MWEIACTGNIPCEYKGSQKPRDSLFLNQMCVAESKTAATTVLNSWVTSKGKKSTKRQFAAQSPSCLSLLHKSLSRQFDALNHCNVLRNRSLKQRMGQTKTQPRQYCERAGYPMVFLFFFSAYLVIKNDTRSKIQSSLKALARFPPNSAVSRLHPKGLVEFSFYMGCRELFIPYCSSLSENWSPSSAHHPCLPSSCPSAEHGCGQVQKVSFPFSSLVLRHREGPGLHKKRIKVHLMKKRNLRFLDS